MEKNLPSQSGPPTPSWVHQDPAEQLDWTVRILMLTTEIVALEEPQEIARRVVRALVDEMGLPMVSILLADETGTLAYAADHGVNDAVKALGFREDGTAYTAFRKGRAIFVADVLADARANPMLYDLMSAFAVLPIYHRDRRYGVIMVTFPEKHPFPPIECVVLSTFAHQMGIAIDNGRLHRLEWQRIGRLAALATLSEALAPALRVQEVARIFGACLETAPAFSGFALWTARDETLELAVRAGLKERGTPRTTLAPERSRILSSLAGRSVAQIPAKDLWADLDLGAARPVEEASLRVFALPLMNSGVREGLLVYRAQDEPLDPDLLTALGERAALALHHARRYETSLTAAGIDPLTCLLDRRSFLDRAGHLVASGVPMALFLLGSAAFHERLDPHGLPAGDRLRVLLGQTLRAMAGPSDLVARLDEDRFALLLAPADPERAERVAASLEATLGEVRLELGEERSLPMPAVRVSQVGLQPGKGLEDLLRSVEQAPR